MAYFDSKIPKLFMENLQFIDTLITVSMFNARSKVWKMILNDFFNIIDFIICYG